MTHPTYRPRKLCSTFAVNEEVFDFNATLLRFSRKSSLFLVRSPFFIVRIVPTLRPFFFFAALDWKKNNLCFSCSDDVLSFFLLSEELESMHNCVMSALMLGFLSSFFCSLSQRHFYGWETLQEGEASTKQRAESSRRLCRLNNNGPGLTRLRTPRSRVNEGNRSQKACTSDKSQPGRSLPGVYGPLDFRQPRAVHYRMVFLSSPHDKLHQQHKTGFRWVVFHIFLDSTIKQTLTLCAGMLTATRNMCSTAVSETFFPSRRDKNGWKFTFFRSIFSRQEISSWH